MKTGASDSKEKNTMKNEENDKARYTSNGYKDREDYLNTLADNYGVDSMFINELAGMLGPSEDFDGLISDLDDFQYMGLLDEPENKEEDP
jgi:hypothetical protein